MASIAAAGLNAAPSDDVIDARRGAIRALEVEILRIDAEAGAAADAHAASARRAADLSARVTETARALSEARAARSVALERLSARIVGLYGQQPSSLVEVILASGGLSAAADTQEVVEAVAEQDRGIVEQIEATRERLARVHADLLDSRAAVEASVVESRTRLGELEALIGRRRLVLDDAQTALDRIVVRDARRRGAEERAAAAAAAVERDLLQRAEPVAVTVAMPAVSAPIPSSDDVAGALTRIAQCESGGNPRAVSPDGRYRGKYQFDLGTWQSLGGSGDPVTAPEAEQDRIAGILYARSGAAPWPVCGYR